MKEVINSAQTLNNDFSVLTEGNKKRVIEMIRFLIITQNSIVPEFLNPDESKLKGEDMLNK
ncbi:MAG: hypothetical protein LBH20_05775 [Treponema sp.]|jgi:hypothetical protein|nr:hypothetical protein [Treponema sp.]